MRRVQILQLLPREFASISGVLILDGFPRMDCHSLAKPHTTIHSLNETFLHTHRCLHGGGR